MLNFWRPLLARCVVVCMVISAMLPGASFAQDSANSYTYEDLDVTVEWSDQWKLGFSESGILALSSQQAINAIVSVVPAASFSLEEAVFLVADADQSEILEDNSADEPASILFRFDGDVTHGLSNAYYVNDGEAIVIVTLSTAPALISGGIDAANDGITVNGEPILGFLDDSSSISTGDGTPVVDAPPADETPEATEESTRTTRSSRGSSSGQVTPEATEDSEDATAEATVGTRSSRGNTAGQETPEATDEATAAATEESTTGESSLEDGIYVSENWQYQISWDTEIWQLADEDSDGPSPNGITLTNGDSLLIVTGTDLYGSDPAACLSGENAYYGSESSSITEWDFALDANGDPLTHEGDDLAWGVFSYTFTSSEGNEVAFVDYISCETIPGQDGLLMVHLISVEEMYNTNLDLTLDILDTLKFQP